MSTATRPAPTTANAGLAPLSQEEQEWVAEQIKNAPPISEHTARVVQAVLNAHSSPGPVRSTA